MKSIYLLGIGHNTPVFMDLAEQCGFRIAGLYHYNEERTGEEEHGYPIIGSFEDLWTLENLTDKAFLLTMGNNDIRTELAHKIRSKGGKTPTIIHPTAVVSRFVKIAEGVVISPFSYIQADSEICKDTIILSGVNISHNNYLGEGCFLAGGTTIGAYTIVGSRVFFGQGVLTISEKVKKIGDRVFIGAGSLVTSSVESDSRIVGRPARSIVESKTDKKL